MADGVWHKREKELMADGMYHGTGKQAADDMAFQSNLVL
jgi:hypothetical protein